MKKKGLCSRILSLLLVAVMVVSMLPVSVFAVTGDIVVGDTGVDNDTIGDTGTINWPIKIYDYLNDGMLFEPATANKITGDTSSDSVLGGWYGLYGGGTNMPETLQGTDYTGNSAYLTGGSGTNYYSSLDTTDAAYSITKVEAEHYVSPQYMRIQKHASQDGNSLCLVNFSIKANARKITLGSTDYFSNCLAFDDVRYMVLVYKSNDIADQDIDIWLESHDAITQDATTGVLTHNQSWKNVSVDISLEDSTGWKAAVIDLKTVDASLTRTSDSSATTWDAWQACSAVYLRMLGMESGDRLDISHVSFFGTQGEAERYGENAVAFDNDPGECLLKDRTITWTTGGDGEVTTATMPGASAPTHILTNRYRYYAQNSPSTSTVNSNANGSDGIYSGLDLSSTDTSKGYYTTGYNTDTYKTWTSSGTTWSLPNDCTTGVSYSFTFSGVTATQKTETTTGNGTDYTRKYVNLTNTGKSKILLTEFREERSDATLASYYGYAVLVYRTHGLTETDKFGYFAGGWNLDKTTLHIAGVMDASSFPDDSLSKGQEFVLSDSMWQSSVVKLSDAITDTTMSSLSAGRLKMVGLYLPALTNGKSLDIAYVAYFADQATADSFASSATGYMNSGKTYTTTDSPEEEHKVTFKAGRVWNSGNNASFGLYLGNQGGGWSYTSSGANNADNAGNNTTTNGYYNYRIGYDTTKASIHQSNTNRKPFGDAAQAFDAAYTATTGNTPATPTSGKTNQIYYVKLSAWANSNDGSGSTTQYTTNHLDFDGYDLRTTLTSGGMTMGLLEGTIKDGRPVYRQETVEYVAELLYNALRIPQFDATGNYNYNFVSGAASDQFATDLNGDGDTDDMIDTNGDQVKETSEAAMDLATALRHELGIEFSLQQPKGTEPLFGDYDTTAGKKLVGTFQDCRENIDTCMDAAYFLLNNIFVGGSYNQVQDDFSYLTLSHATLDQVDENGVKKTAYVFDAGYATKVEDYAEGTTISYLDADKYTAQCAVDYNYYGKKDADGNVIGDGTISLMNDQLGSKDLWCYQGNSTTTRFPFMPVVDAEDEYAKQIRSPYFRDDGTQMVASDKNTYVNRNYNYVMASNGEFVYYEDDDLFFEFEGDDDVYLFINDQLVLDIGGAHSITAVKMNVNDYVEWARGIKANAAAYAALTETERDRVDALALMEGQICSFDFYYMERHGYGANCRIVTNMHVTDPSLSVEKNATQFGEKVEFGGAVDASSPIGYEFKVTNTGNTKLYNLTFTDDIIGVKLDPENGLTVAAGMNGSHVRDAYGGTLEASDLTATVVGINESGETTTVNVTFTSNDELKDFLRILQANGTESGLEGAEITNAGSGLWVGSTVSIRGMYYMLTLAQVEKGGMENIVYVTATTEVKATDAGNETLRSDAKHRVYTSGAPVYYQWAGHELFLGYQELVTDSILESVHTDSQLNKYFAFFDKIDITDSKGTVTGADLSKVHIALCDKYGNPGATESTVSQGVDVNNASGYYVNYPSAGTYSFHVLVHLNENSGGYKAGTKASDMAEDTFAIIRVTVYVADVEDSVFVLDYGLKTESLDAGGALFKGDELFGASGTMQAKLMGVSTTQPSYLSARSNSVGNRISFSALGTGDMRKITFPDGYFNMNVAIDSDGKDISYDASTGAYSLTEVGTVRINADVPSDWSDVRIYYWYDNGANNGWPGTPMTKKDEGGSAYYLDIPADVGYVIISSDDGKQQTGDLEITPGVEASITVSDRPDGKTYYPAVVSNVVKYADAHVVVPSSWQEVWLYCWRDDGTSLKDWPGEKMTMGDDGKYTGKIPSETSYVIVNDGGINQTDDLDVLAGKEVWISLDSEAHSVRDDGKHLFSATMAYNQSQYTVHAKVPDSWGNAYLHYWLTGTADGATQWPGVAMTKGDDGWYSFQVPAGVSYMVVNSGNDADPDQDGVQVPYQTVNLTVNAGLEAWITVDADWDYQNGTTSYYQAHVAYSAEGEDAGFTFTPTDFLETESSVWLALTVHTTGEVPSGLSASNTTGTIDINNEVQMFKKVTVLPATVVYYEDDFAGVTYPVGEGGFSHHGEGSGQLTQSVDQKLPYGQDPTYQDAANSLYSGDSMTQFQITGYDTLAEFTFTGTGFELIGRTDASKSGIIVVEVFNKAGESIQYFPVINEFDNGADGGEEGIYQVPVVRIKGLEHGQYRVVISGNPTYDFDRCEAEGGDIKDYLMDTRLYIDGLRIYQPVNGGVHEAYNATENDAEFLELRDLITGGTVAVGDVTSGGLTLSSGTTTWTENLLGDDFEDESEVFVGNQVESSEDYLIQGPNNEVYMEGTTSNSALVFYVQEDGSAAHELQLAIRALDYRMFFGTGYSALNAPIQYGVQLVDGSYAWKPLTTVQSGTEQYYSIPYTECPQVDGKYQVVIRANGTEGTLAMVSYSSLKLVGLDLMKVDGVGEDTILYYENGILVNWLLWGDINGTGNYGAGDAVSYYRFKNGKLTMTFTQDSYVALKTSTNVAYMISGGNVTDKTAASMVKAEGLDTAGKLFVPGGKEVTFTLTQDSTGAMVLSYCAHSYEEEVVQEGSCTVEGITVYTCAACQYQKTVTTEATGHELGEGQQTTAPTCTEDGVMSYPCSICQGAVTEPIPALGHTMDQGIETTAPGCETEGVMTYTCTVCGHTETDPIPAAGHSMGEGGTCTVCGVEVCAHQWNAGSVTTEATCTTDGEKLYTCLACGGTKTETISAPGHTMEDGSCTVCDYTTVRTVYFRNSQNWSNVNIYTWSDAGKYTGSWPGTAMTLVEGTTNLYRYNVPLDAVNVSFNDGGNQKTNDLNFPTNGRDLYSWAIGDWVTYEPPVLSREYCLMGHIDGADYGTGDDWSSVGSYVFVGQTLTVTFQSDSYVGIKTTDSGSWYWAPDYISDTTGTFYLNGNNEKMFVPGGQKVTFTLVENSDGSLTLSYVAAGATMLSSEALDLSSIEKQMSATYVVGAAVSEETVQQPEEDTTSVPVLTMKYPSLSFESEVQYNIYYTVDNAEMVLDMGLLVFDSQLTDGTIANAAQVLPGFETDGSVYLVKTGGISAKNLGDTLYFKVYAQLSDGSYVYSDMKSYCAVDYASTILGRESSSDYMKSLVVAMLNYGAEAQLYFGHDTDDLMNAGLTAEQQALVSTYDESMVAGLVDVDSTKAGSFVYDGSSFAKRAPSVSFDGAFSINYYFTAANVPDDGMTLYYWDLDTYGAVDQLTIENATGSMEMVATDVEHQFWGQVSGIAAKQIDETVFVVGVYQHDGITYTTGILNYSIGRYCAGLAVKETSDQRSFAQATAVYGYYAKAYFDNI